MASWRVLVVPVQSIVLTILVAAGAIGGAEQESTRPAAAQGPRSIQAPIIGEAASDPKFGVEADYTSSDQSREKLALIQEVVQVLERNHPKNPGRQKTFGRMWLRGLTPENREAHLLKQTGWILQVREAARIPGGWRATVAVRASVTHLDGWPTVVRNQHYETYVLRDGKLLLEDDYVDPEIPFWQSPYDLAEGLIEDVVAGNTRRPKPQPPERCSVRVQLDHKPDAVERELASEVEAVLRRERPENPGRLKSYPKLELTWHAPDGTVERWKLKIVGWKLHVRRAERIPGGWRATVWASARLKNDQGFEPPMISTHHIEIYTFRRGKLERESDSVDPKRDPAQGLGP
jgi:hypothetical protein